MISYITIIDRSFVSFGSPTFNVNISKTFSEGEAWYFPILLVRRSEISVGVNNAKDEKKSSHLRGERKARIRKEKRDKEGDGDDARSEEIHGLWKIIFTTTRIYPFCSSSRVLQNPPRWDPRRNDRGEATGDIRRRAEMRRTAPPRSL